MIQQLKLFCIIHNLLHQFFAFMPHLFTLPFYRKRCVSDRNNYTEQIFVSQYVFSIFRTYFLLFILKFHFIHFWKIQQLRNSHIKPHSNLTQSLQLWILCFSLIILLSVDCVIPDNVASLFVVIPLSTHRSVNLFIMASEYVMQILLKSQYIFSINDFSFVY